MPKNSIEVNEMLMAQFVETQASDFLLETAIYKAALDQQFQATHGGSYQDRVTGKTRQYDVRATKNLEDKISLELAIECKALTAKSPILINRIPRLPSESFHQKIIPATMFGNNYVGYSTHHKPAEDARVETVKLIKSLYPPNEYVGKSIVQVKCIEDTSTSPPSIELTGKNDELHDKWSQALASANDLIRKAAAPDRRNNSTAAATLVLPILIVSDDMLWVADYSEGGILQGPPVQLEEATLFCGDSFDLAQDDGQELLISHLHVMTRSGAIKFLTNINRSEEFQQRFTN